ncbi:MAG: precorrin-2 C(20)-methyltransferase [Deltaproteobacteria bacterium]|jgi:precorrin-2/cobalt-factor-2 C20-methyltransferase|nr:precorrin-2 C(20)-methyltransferase [Deltaproteobacteria bacterium]
MTHELGALYGLGVGPGDPDLLTLKAVKILSEVDVIFTASASSSERSLALTIASPHLKADAETRDLDFPMTHDPQKLQESWRQNAQAIVAVLRKGQSAAFLTLGDPLTYSTYAYLLPFVQEFLPRAKIITVPGVTSYQLAAAKLNRPLCLNRESLTVVSGSGGEEKLATLVDASDNLVIMKSRRDRSEIAGLLRAKNLASRTAVCSMLSLPGETIIESLPDELPDALSYFTLFLVNKRLAP